MSEINELEFELELGALATFIDMGFNISHILAGTSPNISQTVERPAR